LRMLPVEAQMRALATEREKIIARYVPKDMSIAHLDLDKGEIELKEIIEPEAKEEK